MSHCPSSAWFAVFILMTGAYPGRLGPQCPKKTVQQRIRLFHFYRQVQSARCQQSFRCRSLQEHV